MAHLNISTLLVASFALSGAFAGLIPNILPDIIPVSKSSAKAQLWRGAGMGKGTINGAVTWWTATINSDPELTPECKACCAAAAQEIRGNILAQIDGVTTTLSNKIDQTLSLLLATVWTDIVGSLGGANGLIADIVNNLETSLEGAKQTCILQTASATTVTA